MKTAIGYSKNSKQKFPDYFFEEVHPESQSGAGRNGAGGELGPAHTPPPPPPEPPPVQQQTKKEKISSKKSIAEGFNKFYSCVGSKLADKIKNQNSTNGADFNHKSFVKKSTNNFHFQEVSSEKILKIVNSLKNKSSSGTDNISNVLLKVIAPYLMKPLYKLLNRSLETGSFPDELKVAIIIPLYKGRESGSQFEYTNYRPISLLPSISKVLEKMVDYQLRNFLNYEDVLYSKQFGFRGLRGCDQALLLFTDFAKRNVFLNFKVLTAFLDLKKAFDTVDHEILLDKLYLYGIKGAAHDWFRDYLKNRKQLVQIPSGEKSSYRTINLGVPQGSILGPLLFLLYMNDLAFCVPEFYTILFADDTSLSLAGNDYTQLLLKFNTLLSKVSVWLKPTSSASMLARQSIYYLKIPGKI